MASLITEFEPATSESELMAVLSAEMADERFRDLIVMGGHFMLFYHPTEKRLVPGIFQDIADPAFRQMVEHRVGIFPLYTWDLAVRLQVEYAKRRDRTSRLLLLINDWQYVPNEGSAAEHRSAFYDAFHVLPPSYATKLDTLDPTGADVLLSSRKHRLAYPETWLKYRFQKTAEKHVKSGALSKRYLDDRPGQSEISFTDNAGVALPLITCGITGCAGEVTEMIAEVHRGGGRFMIMFAPNECRNPVRAGVEIALKLYNLEGMKIIVADPGGSGEMSTDEIFGPSVSVVKYES